MLENVTAVLTFRILGQIICFGKYEYREKTNNGNLLPEDQRLFINKRSRNSDCHKIVHLNSTFCTWAMSMDARPDRKESYKNFVFWQKMNKKERLSYHIAKYAIDNGSFDYEFEILE